MDLSIIGRLALVATLPAFTVNQYTIYSAQSPDYSAMNAGFISKRWLAENLLSLVYALSIILAIVLSYYGYDIVLFRDWPVWASVLWAVVIVSDLI